MTGQWRLPEAHCARAAFSGIPHRLAALPGLRDSARAALGCPNCSRNNRDERPWALGTKTNGGSMTGGTPPAVIDHNGSEGHLFESTHSLMGAWGSKPEAKKKKKIPRPRRRLPVFIPPPGCVTARAPTSTRAIGFCAIWVRVSPSSSSLAGTICYWTLSTNPGLNGR